MRSFTFFLSLISFFAFAGAVMSQETISGKITYVYDGDTIKVGDQKVRHWGLHVPEVDTMDGRNAKRFLSNYILGMNAKCILNGKKSYDRLVGKCFVGNADIAISVVMNGFGRDCPRFSSGYYRQFELASVQSWKLPKYCT